MKLNLKPIKRLLVANRGEIAVRIMRTCRDMGIETVAVYSEADAGAPHVRYADQAVLIGGPAAKDSYLRGDHIISVAHKTGADAIHPGYGFLAEQAAFAEAVYDAGLIFVGPPPHAITVMGDKLTARATAHKAGVPIVPGSEKGLSDADLITAADSIGYPLLVKASAGGGGKGMRPVHDPADLADAIAGARREAESAFGNGTVYLERLITNGRHIEIQLLSDAHGNAIHFGERECSLQRRHQKLVEEAPSAAVSAETRAEMGAIACELARAIDYVGVGTIEFLLDDRGFYFLEMNTRLQVEHPVTELVYGVDLVREQLLAAMGEKLTHQQNDIVPNGWAIECRVNAEDPFSNFMPSIGTINYMTLPAGPGVRVDTGVEQGSEISPYYDSMISKLICYGATREAARQRMLRALKEYKLAGLTTNIPFHIQMMQWERFISADFDTNTVEQDFKIAKPTQIKEAAVMAALAEQKTQKRKRPTIKQPQSHSQWKWSNA